MLSSWAGRRHRARGRCGSPALANANCLKCHADITSANTLANHYHIYLAGWQQAGRHGRWVCKLSCGARDRGRGERPLCNAGHSPPVCEQCHTAAAP